MEEKNHSVDFLVIVDFEASCDEGKQPIVNRDNQEIIGLWALIQLILSRISLASLQSPPKRKDKIAV
jgi:hypothetical protein